MKIKELLSEYAKVEGQMNIALAEYQKEEEKQLESMKSLSDIDDLPSGTKRINQVEEQALALNDKYQIFIKYKNRWEKLKEQIVDLIYKLPNQSMMEIVYFRYLNSKQWVDVSDKVGYSVKQCQRIRNTALEIMERHL